MITKTINGKEILFVQVPEGKAEYNLRPETKSIKGIIRYYSEINKRVMEIFLPEDSYFNHIIGLASNLTEDEWKGIVEGDDRVFEDYCDEYWCAYTALASGQSLLQSLNLNLETTLLILKR